VASARVAKHRRLDFAKECRRSAVEAFQDCISIDSLLGLPSLIPFSRPPSKARRRSEALGPRHFDRPWGFVFGKRRERRRFLIRLLGCVIGVQTRALPKIQASPRYQRGLVSFVD